MLNKKNKTMTSKNINQVLGVEENSKITKDKPDAYRYRYPVLSYISLLFRIFAVIIFIVCIVIGINQLEWGDNVLALISFAVGIFIGLLFAATSEVIKVFVDIEYNTRKISEKI